MKLHDLITQTEQPFGVKGLTHVVPERLLRAKQITQADLPVMLSELDLDQLRGFFVQQAAVLVKARIPQ